MEPDRDLPQVLEPDLTALDCQKQTNFPLWDLSSINLQPLEDFEKKQHDEDKTEQIGLHIVKENLQKQRVFREWQKYPFSKFLTLGRKSEVLDKDRTSYHLAVHLSDYIFGPPKSRNTFIGSAKFYCEELCETDEFTGGSNWIYKYLIAQLVPQIMKLEPEKTEKLIKRERLVDHQQDTSELLRDLLMLFPEDRHVFIHINGLAHHAIRNKSEAVHVTKLLKEITKNTQMLAYIKVVMTPPLLEGGDAKPNGERDHPHLEF